jgi:hypothetical protein
MKASAVLALVAALATGAAGAPVPNGDRQAPSPEMKKLDFLVGRWSAKRALNPSGRHEFTMTESSETTWAPGGRFLQTRTTSTGPDNRPVTVLSMLGYDSSTGQYHMWVFSPFVDLPLEWSGSLEGARLVLTMLVSRPISGGIGAMVTRESRTPEGFLRLEAVNADSPAGKAGLKAGDLITKVDGRSLEGLTTPQVLARLRGEPGSSVRLTVRSEGRDREVTLTRQSIGLPPRQVFVPRSPAGYSVIQEVKRGEQFEKASEEAFTASP